jgi:uncharacterized SAM-binding protein YcdF (DUF218 family)
MMGLLREFSHRTTPIRRTALTRKTGRFPSRAKFGLLLAVPLLWVGYRELRSQLDTPQAIMVLGGDTKREDFAATFARQHPQLPIWVSGGSNPEYTEGVFSDAGISHDRLHIDRAAVDTVTNFTTLADTLKSRGVRSVYLVTSDYHMLRARTIGEIVFGSRGISIKPISVTSREEKESLLKALRDGARAVLWVTTGYTASDLSGRYANR